MPNHYAEQEEEIRKEQEEHRKKIMKKENKMEEIEFELDNKTILKLALLAHEKNITLNDLIVDVLKQGIKDGEYRFEHDKRPQLLNEAE